MALPHVKIIATIEDFFFHGSKSVGITVTQLSSTSVVASKGILIKAADANTGYVFVGKNASTTVIGTDPNTDGFELGAGSSVVVPVDNATKIYLIASAASQRVSWIAL
jgi:hypothetical protein